MAHGMEPPPDPEALAPTAGDGNLAKAMEVAVSEFRQGRLGEAEAGLEAILKSDPNSAGAIHFLGLIAHRKGAHERAIELLSKAAEMNRVVPYFHGNLAEVFRSLGRHAEAIASCEQALELYAVYPEALNTLGAAHYEQRNLAKAEESLRRALEFKPNFAAAHANLGNVLRARGRHGEAADSYRQAVRHDPKLVGAQMALGNSLRTLGLLDEAAESFRAALAVAPEDARILASLGTVLSQARRTDEAIDTLRRALVAEPTLAEAHANLGTALVEAGHRDEALAAYAAALQLRRGPDAAAPDDSPRAGVRFTTPAKLRHDIAQCRWLLDAGHLSAGFADRIADFEAALGELEAAGATGPTALSADQQRRLANSYNRLVHLGEAPALAAGALAEGVDAAAAAAALQQGAVAEIDDFLRDDALAALQRFCVDSTIWFDFGSGEDRLRSHLNDGLSCGLLLQIAEELRARLPQALGPHPLTRAVASSDGAAFSDDEPRSHGAAFNATFWVAPDGAEGGGLRIHEPSGSADEAGITEIVGQPNRIAIFEAARPYSLTGAAAGAGHDERRIAITLLFGNPPSAS